MPAEKKTRFNLACLLVALWRLLLSRMGDRGASVMAFGKNRAKLFAEKEIATRFDDVAGVEEAKQELREIVDYLKDPRGLQDRGGRMPKGVLFVGAARVRELFTQARKKVARQQGPCARPSSRTPGGSAR